MKRLTKEQAAIISLYTGISCCDFNHIHEYAEKLLDYPIYTDEFADKVLMGKLKELCKEDFKDLCFKDDEKTNQEDNQLPCHNLPSADDAYQISEIHYKKLKNKRWKKTLVSVSARLSEAITDGEFFTYFKVDKSVPALKYYKEEFIKLLEDKGYTVFYDDRLYEVKIIWDIKEKNK